jgi:hypothetical protein
MQATISHARALIQLVDTGNEDEVRRVDVDHLYIAPFHSYSVLAVFGRYSDPSVHHEMGRGSSTRCRSCTNDIAAVMMVGVPTDKVGHPRLFVKLGAFKGFFPTIICYTHAHSPTMYTHVVSFHSDRVIPPTISHSIAEILGFMYIPQHHVSRAMHIIRLFKPYFYKSR